MKNYMRYFSVMALATLAALMPEFALANTQTTTGGLGSKLCEIYYCYVNSDLMIVIATMAILFLGIGAFFGKVNWGLVIIVVLGIVVTTGAMAIAVKLVGDEGSTCKTSGGTCTL